MGDWSKSISNSNVGDRSCSSRVVLAVEVTVAVKGVLVVVVATVVTVVTVIEVANIVVERKWWYL